jgi:hypothetical protein
MATYTDGNGVEYQRVSVQVWVPERMISWLVEHTGRSRLAAKRHLADTFLHLGGELSFWDGAISMVIDREGSFGLQSVEYARDEEAEIQDLLANGYTPYLDDDGAIVREGGGLNWGLA